MPGQKPTEKLIRENGYSGFISAILRKSRGMRFTDILREVGYKIPEMKDWTFLHVDSINNPLSSEEIIKSAVRFFKDVIIEESKDNGLISDDGVPTIQDLKDLNYYGFISTLQNKGISYSDILEAAGYEPNELNSFYEIGNAFHWMIEKFFLEETRKRSFKSFYEINPSTKNPLYANKRVDNGIIFDEDLRSYIDDFLGLSKDDHIELINID